MCAILRTKEGGRWKEGPLRLAKHSNMGKYLVTLLQSYMPLEHGDGSMKLSTRMGRERGGLSPSAHTYMYAMPIHVSHTYHREALITCKINFPKPIHTTYNFPPLSLHKILLLYTSSKSPSVPTPPLYPSPFTIISPPIHHNCTLTYHQHCNLHPP